MNTSLRIGSILRANSLDSSTTGFPAFRMADLRLGGTPDFDLPDNLRLGHLAERVVAELINVSENYRVLYENIQIVEGNNTVGELDFIIQNIESAEVTHLELAYKFYLYDPLISEDPIKNWIGPNRNDSLSEKLDKLRKKQFPLLYHDSTAHLLRGLDIDNISQKLCLLASMYVPHQLRGTFSLPFAKAIKGYYLDFESFSRLDTYEKTYYLPRKREWGMDPASHEDWYGYQEIELQLRASLMERRALLCWEKCKDEVQEYFVTWW